VESKTKPQYQQVIDVMTANGGFATLGLLYHTVDVSAWQTKTPFKTINRIVQDNRFFFRIKPGLWALNSHKDTVLRAFEIEKPKKENQEAFDHTYFQGLLVEVGNLRGFQTFVPNQDKRKRFLLKALGEVSTLERILDFSYEGFVKRARTIDVIWFNKRQMPASFFEVEHSTDIYNSLIKFSDLIDFHSNFCIVANNARKREYEQKLSSNIFSAIKKRVNFLSYENLSELHTNTFRLSKSSEGIKFLQN
jgi:hypothetical protein